ncbi:hypothetical protein H2203_000762 [Taxawa tesnikishii (nom. ined.)]|nr:hypothetical protein H2203_000762 [Dothideales sp. JES 119]
MVLLAQVNPYLGPDVPEMHELQTRHSQMICGIAAHVKDRGVASVAIRSLAHAAECLTDRREQEEVLSIFEKINKETGWRIGFVFKELKEKWGWHDSLHNPRLNSINSNNSCHLIRASCRAKRSCRLAVAPPPPPPPPQPPAAAPRRPPSGIINPLYATADFTMPQHPYQNVYVAPNAVPHPHPTALYY